MVYFLIRSGILSWIILGEKYGKSDFFSCLFCLAGALFIVKPSFLFNDIVQTPTELFGKFLAICASFAGGLIPVVLRSLNGKLNEFEIT